MRRRLAQILAVFTSLVILILSALFAYVQQRRLPAADAAAPSVSAPEPEIGAAAAPATADDVVAGGGLLERGKLVYQEQRCSACHSIGGAGNRRNPLDGVGSRLDRDMLRRWIVDPRSIDPKVWKPPYNDLSSADLDALVEYLCTLIDSGEKRQ